jgi:hypothetical protein
MPFPLSRSDTINVDVPASVDLDNIMQSVVFALEDAEPSRVSLYKQQITFRGGPFRLVHNWNILVPITSGNIHFCVEPGRVVVRYRIYFLEAFLFYTLPLCFYAAYWIIALRPHAVAFYEVTLVIWLMLLGLTYFITELRFPCLIREAVERSVRLQTQTI